MRVLPSCEQAHSQHDIVTRGLSRQLVVSIRIFRTLGTRLDLPLRSTVAVARRRSPSANSSGRDTKPIGYCLWSCGAPSQATHSTIGEQQRMRHVSLPKKWSSILRMVTRRQSLAGVPTASTSRCFAIATNISVSPQIVACYFFLCLRQSSFSRSNQHHGPQHYTEVVPSWYSRTQSDVVRQ